MKRVLIIEDNEPIRSNTIELLELARYEVIYATDGEAGLEMAKKENPDLIICDILMPKMDGYTVLQHIRREPSLNNIKFIFLTASSEKKELEKGIEMGANDYIIKPFDCEELLHKIQKFCP